MVLQWKCAICHIMVNTEDLKTHRKSKEHKLRLDTLDILETLKERIYKGEYSDDEVNILLETLKISNPFNLDFN